VHRSLTIALVLLALTPVACDHGDPASFAEGTTMARLQHAGRIRIGVKSDQPSLGFRDPATDNALRLQLERDLLQPLWHVNGTAGFECFRFN